MIELSTGAITSGIAFIGGLLVGFAFRERKHSRELKAVIQVKKRLDDIPVSTKTAPPRFPPRGRSSSDPKLFM